MSNRQLKTVSHLDLKFLDLKILSVQQACTPSQALPRIDRFLLREKRTDPEQENKNTVESQQRNITKLSSKYDQLTNDVTNNLQDTMVMDNGENNTDNLLSYLSAGTDTIYKQIDKTKTLTASEHSPTNTNLAQKMSPKMQRYSSQIQRIQLQNHLIHNEIIKMYLSKLGEKGAKVKNVNNLRLYHQGKSYETPVLDKCTLDDDQDMHFKYKSSDKKDDITAKKVLENFKSTNQLVGDRLKQFNSIEKNRQVEQKKAQRFINAFKKKGIKGLTQKKSKQQKKKLQQFHLPNLIRNKYENFYENLYKPDPKISAAQTPMEDGEVDKLSELKKKLANNNLDKHFQMFLLDRKMRVPQFLKNLR